MMLGLVPTLGLFIGGVSFIGGVVLRRFLVPSGAFRAVILLLLTAYGLALVGRTLLGP